MSRTSHIHYIAPSAISVTPNANGADRDIAVYIARGAKIKVYSPRAGIDMEDNSYQEWTLTGRNRQLGSSTAPYTIYARLPIDNKDGGYLVFAKKTWNAGLGQWTDKYPFIGPNGMEYPFNCWDSGANYYVRLGDVNAPENGQRTLNLDTGILDTDDFNTHWALNPDALPLRIELGCTINDEDVGTTPYIYWGQTLRLVAGLVEGWTGTDIQRFDHWEITRDTGDTNADAAWNVGTSAVGFRSTGIINLQHGRGSSTDDFRSTFSSAFTIKAMENTGTAESPVYAVLKSISICILAETWERYELELSSAIVSYNPQSGRTTPSTDLTFSIRSTNQKSETSQLTSAQFTAAGLVAEYAVTGAATWTTATVTSSGDLAIGTIPISAFQQQKSVNVRLCNAVGTELHRTTIAFLRDGEDSKEREWIFLRSNIAITFSDNPSAIFPKPALISGGQVNPSGAATGSDTNSNQDGWVPQGWYDEQQGTDSVNRYEYSAYRDYVKESGGVAAHWGAFTNPVLWSHYGKDGPMLYPAGKWESRYYTSSRSCCPYVLHVNDDSSDDDSDSPDSDDNSEKFYFLNDDSAGPNDVPGISPKWTEMTQVDVIYAKFGIIDYGKMSSAIFCGDWMFSQYGKLYTTATNVTDIDGTNYDSLFTINGETGAPFSFFNPQYPQGGVAGTFAPSYALNLLTGAIIEAKGKFTIDENGDVTIEGKITCSSGEIGGFEIGSNYIGGMHSQGGFLHGSKINSDGGAQFSVASGSDNYALRVHGRTEIIGNGADVVINTATGSDSQHGDLVINGYVKLLIPKSDYGLQEGEIYIDNGFIKIKT